MIMASWVRPRLAVGLVLLLGSLLVSHASGPDAALRGRDCPFLVVAPEVEGETIACGRLIVPENRARSSGPTISLQVAIVAQPRERAGAPIVYLEGGPGGSAVMSVPDVWTRSALRTTPTSWSSISAARATARPPSTAPRTTRPTTPLRACRDRLVAAGVDLGAYNSRESASDVADLLEVLDIEEATLFGVSYGTRLALTVMRDHPERIVSAILDGVYPPHVDGYDEQAENGYLAFERLFDDCGPTPAATPRTPTCAGPSSPWSTPSTPRRCSTTTTRRSPATTW
jgi:pimeloyl-ACP methyl ester carboxylesterase